MSSIHSPMRPPIQSPDSARKAGFSRRQTIAFIGFLLMAGPLGIAAQHLKWPQWIADQRTAIFASKGAIPTPACVCPVMPCR